MKQDNHTAHRNAAVHWEALKLTSDGLITALEAIAGMSVDDDTDHAQLLALCVATARIALDEAKGARR